MSDGSDKSRRRKAARRLFGAAGRMLDRAIVRAEEVGTEVVNAADILLMESQEGVYTEMHRRFTEKAVRGEGGIESALEALDAMWENIRQLRGGATAILHTLSARDAGIQDRRQRFYVQSTEMLEDAIRQVFAEDLGHLAVPPERLAVLVRIMLEGLVVELAQARTAEDVRQVDQAYADMRALFEKFVLHGGDSDIVEAIELEAIPLPW